MKSTQFNINLTLFKEVIAAIVLATVAVGIIISATEPFSAGIFAAVMS